MDFETKHMADEAETASRPTDWRKRTSELWKQNEKLRLIVQAAVAFVPRENEHWHRQADVILGDADQG